MAAKPSASDIRFSMNGPQFRAQLERAAKNMGGDVETVVRHVALNIETSVVRRTPVDTGRARASWNVSEEYADLTVQPEGSGSYTHMPTQPGQLTGRNAIYISNNIEYIIPLEYGHSKQSPNGMAGLAVAEAAANLKGVSSSGPAGFTYGD